jgi:hypothetical protein
LRVFPERGFGLTSGWRHTIEQLDAALGAARLVIISKPVSYGAVTAVAFSLTFAALSGIGASRTAVGHDA